MCIHDSLLWRFYGHPGLRPSQVLRDSPWAGSVTSKYYVLILSLNPEPHRKTVPDNFWDSFVSGDLHGFRAPCFLYSFCSFCFLGLHITWYFGKEIPYSKLGPWELHTQLGPHQLPGKSHIILLKCHILKLSASPSAHTCMHTGMHAHTHTHTHTHTHKTHILPTLSPTQAGASGGWRIQLVPHSGSWRSCLHTLFHPSTPFPVASQ